MVGSTGWQCPRRAWAWAGLAAAQDPSERPASTHTPRGQQRPRPCPARMRDLGTRTALHAQEQARKWPFLQGTLHAPRPPHPVPPHPRRARARVDKTLRQGFWGAITLVSQGHTDGSIVLSLRIDPTAAAMKRAAELHLLADS